MSISVETSGSDIFGSPDLDSAQLVPVLSEDDIDYNLVYALFTFIATLEGQLNVTKGDSLQLIDDSNSYWWLVKGIQSEQVGYVPAENIETPLERLARLNKFRNEAVTAATLEDSGLVTKSGTQKDDRKLTFDQFHEEIYQDYSSEDELNTAVEKSPQSEMKPNGFLRAIRTMTGFVKKRTEEPDSASPKPKSPTGIKRKLTGKQPITSPKQPSPDPINQNTPNRNSLIPQRTQSINDNVIRIYAGNVDLAATFKSVPFDKNMTGRGMVTQALKKFRVQNANSEDYYLSIFINNTERKVENTEVVYKVLDSMRNLIGEQGENRILLNKIVSSVPSVTKVFNSTVTVTYDGIAGQPLMVKNYNLSETTKASDILEWSVKDFKIETMDNLCIFACSAKNEGKIQPEELIKPIVLKAEQQMQRLTLMVRFVEMNNKVAESLANTEDFNFSQIMSPAAGLVVTNPDPDRGSGLFSPTLSANQPGKRTVSLVGKSKDIDTNDEVKRPGTAEAKDANLELLGPKKLRSNPETKLPAEKPAVLPEITISQNEKKSDSKLPTPKSFGMTISIPKRSARVGNINDPKNQTNSKLIDSKEETKPSQTQNSVSRRIKEKKLPNPPSVSNVMTFKVTSKPLVSDEKPATFSFDAMVDSIDNFLNSGIKDRQSFTTTPLKRSMKEMFDDLEQGLDKEIEDLNAEIQSTLSDTMKRNSIRRRSSYFRKSLDRAEIIQEDEIDLLHDNFMVSSNLLDRLEKNLDKIMSQVITSLDFSV